MGGLAARVTSRREVVSQALRRPIYESQIEQAVSSGVLLNLGSTSVAVLRGNGVEVGSSSGFIVPGGVPENSWPIAEGFISKTEAKASPS